MLAYADGDKVEIYDCFHGKWIDCDNPTFHFTSKYRIKPKKLTPYQVYMDAQYPNFAPHKSGNHADIGLEAVIKATKEGYFD